MRHVGVGRAARGRSRPVARGTRLSLFAPSAGARACTAGGAHLGKRLLRVLDCVLGILRTKEGVGSGWGLRPETGRGPALPCGAPPCLGRGVVGTGRGRTMTKPREFAALCCAQRGGAPQDPRRGVLRGAGALQRVAGALGRGIGWTRLETGRARLGTGLACSETSSEACAPLSGKNSACPAARRVTGRAGRRAL